jgi:hypothetical protein
LSQRIDISEHDGVGIDAMIKQAQDERERKMKISRYQGRQARIQNTRPAYPINRGGNYRHF